MAELQVTIGTITFNSEEEMHSGQNFYLLKNTDDFLSALSIRQDEEGRQGEHGTEPGLSLYGARNLPFEVEIHATSVDNRISMEDTLNQELSLAPDQSYDGDDGNRLVTITLENGRVMQIYAKPSAKPSFRRIDATQRLIRFCRMVTFAMYAKDPFLFSTTLEEDDGTESFESTNFTIGDEEEPTMEAQVYDQPTVSVTVDNDGNYPAPAIFTVYGPSVSPVVRNLTTGKYMEFSGGGGLSLAGDEYLEINVLAKTMTKVSGGTETDARPYRSANSEWVYLVPGENEIALTDASPSEQQATIDVEWRDTWN